MLSLVEIDSTLCSITSQIINPNRLYVKSLYKRYLTNALNWYIRRDLWRNKAIEIRADFERNRWVWRSFWTISCGLWRFSGQEGIIVSETPERGDPGRGCEDLSKSEGTWTWSWRRPLDQEGRTRSASLVRGCSTRWAGSNSTDCLILHSDKSINEQS